MSEVAKDILQTEMAHCQGELRKLDPSSDEYTSAANNLAKISAEYSKLEIADQEYDRDIRKIENDEINSQIEIQKAENLEVAEKKRRIFGFVSDILKVVLLILGELFITHYVYNQEDIEGKLADKRKLSKIDLIKRVK